MELTGLGRSTIYHWIADGNFPKPIKVGEQASRWVSSDIDGWIAEQIEKDRG